MDGTGTRAGDGTGTRAADCVGAAGSAALVGGGLQLGLGKFSSCLSSHFLNSSKSSSSSGFVSDSGSVATEDVRLRFRVMYSLMVACQTDRG